MIMADVKIMVCAHKDVKLPKNDWFFPIQAGAVLHDAIPGFTGDNSGIISLIRIRISVN